MKLTDANRRALKAAAMLVPVVVLTHWFAGASPTAPSGGYARQAIPAELSGADRWLSQGDHELSDRAIQILETNDYLLRGYVAESGAGRVELCIVFAKDSRTSIHPPEVCLKGEGARIADTRRHTVPIRGGPAPGIDAMELAIESNGRLRLYWYTYKVGPTFTASFVKQQWLIWWNGLLRRQVGGALVRLSTTVRGRDLPSARRRLLGFSQAVFPHIIAKLRLRSGVPR